VDDEEYDLKELSELTGVKPRTVHFYTQQGLLPRPGTGRGTRYTQVHVDLLRIIRRLQDQHLPLAEIRKRVEKLSSGEARRLAAEPVPKTPKSAAEYIRQVLEQGSRTAVPPTRKDAPHPAIALPGGTAPERSYWERIPLGPDVELHVRRPLSRSLQRRVDQLTAHARTLLKEEP
jgi:DNA-binding transcriptional MerR regulator